MGIVKDRLIREYFKLKNQFDLNEGENCKIICPPEPTFSDIQRMSKEFKVSDLEDKIEAVKNAIKSQEHNKRVKEYYSTDQGVIEKALLITSIKNSQEEILSINNDFEEELTKEIQFVLDDNWCCRYSGGWSPSLEIGIKNNDEKSGFLFKFGHSFTVRFAEKFFKEDYKTKKKYHIEISYGTMGSFNPHEDSMRVKYLLGLGQISNNLSLLNNWINRVEEVEIKIKEIQDKIDKWNKKLQNPFMD